MFNFRTLLSLGFWFSFRWNPLQLSTAWMMVGFFALLILAGVFVPLLVIRARADMPKFEQKAWTGIGRPAIIVGALGFLFTFFAYQQIAFLSGRFWFLAIGIGFVIAEVFKIRTLILEIPRLKDEEDSKQMFKKYLPKSKN